MEEPLSRGHSHLRRIPCKDKGGTCGDVLSDMFTKLFVVSAIDSQQKSFFRKF